MISFFGFAQQRVPEMSEKASGSVKAGWRKTTFAINDAIRSRSGKTAEEPREYIFNHS